MKIVFESEEEKEQFIKEIVEDGIACPHEIGFHDDFSSCIPSREVCDSCWEKYVRMEVESHAANKPEQVQIPQKMVDHIMQRFTECK